MSNVGKQANYNDAIPRVGSRAERDARWPTPDTHFRIENAETGYRERFDGNQWLAEGVTRAAGPIVGTLAKGAHADGVIDDTGTLVAVSNAIQDGTGVGELDVGTHFIAGNQGTISLSGHWRPLRGHSLKIGNGTTVNMVGTVEESARFAFVDLSLGGKFTFDVTSPQAVVPDIWFIEFAYSGVNDVPAAPTVQQGPQQYGAWNLFNTTTQRFKSTLATFNASGVWGETGPSASITKSGVNQGYYEALPEDPGCGGAYGGAGVAPAFRIYAARTDAGGDSVDYACTYAPQGKIAGRTRADIFQWSDIAYHKRSVYAGYDNSGVVTPAPAGGTTATDPAGHVINPPTNAPTLSLQGCLQVNQAYDVAIAYRYDDGTLGPLSAITQATSANAAGAYLKCYVGQAHPDGAVRVCVFAAPHGQTLHLVAEWPVGQQCIDLNFIPSSVDTPAQTPTGATYALGTCTSTLTPLYQAARCGSQGGGGRSVEVQSGLSSLKCPLKLDPTAGLGPSNQGLRIVGAGGVGGISEVRYAGSLVGAAFIANFFSYLLLERVRFTDPNSKCEIGIRFADYSGGNSFYCKIKESHIECRGPHGVGLICDIMSGGTNTHTGSEIVLDGGILIGNAWAFDINGSQTLDFSLTGEVQIFSNGDYPMGPASNGNLSAFSGCLRVRTSQASVDRAFLNGGMTFINAGSNNDRSGGGRAVLRLGNVVCESPQGLTGTAIGIAMSSYDTNGSVLCTEGMQMSQSGAVPFFDVVCFNAGRFDDRGSQWLGWASFSNFGVEGRIASMYDNTKWFFDYTRYGPASGSFIPTQLIFGRLVQPAPNTAPVDAEIPASAISFYLDESGNTLKARVRYQNGTYKSLTTALPLS